MSLDYTDRLNRLAKKAGILEFTSFMTWFKTSRLIKKNIVLIYDYFFRKKLPIKLICGDEEPISKIIKLCPELIKVEVCPTKELLKRDLSALKDCTIFVVQNKIQDTLRLERDIYNKSPNCRVCSVYEYLEFNGINARSVFWRYYSFSLHPKEIINTLKAFYYHLMSYEKINYLLSGLIGKIKSDSNAPLHLSSYLTREKIFCANKAFKSGYLSDDELQKQHKKLMGFCVIEKDIIGLKKYIELYADRYDSNYKKYISQIDDIVSDMKSKIARRKSKDIIINWIDALSNKRLKEETPFLYSLSIGEGTSKAEYAYTCVPHTSATMKTIMTGMDPVEGKLYNYKFLNNDMELLKQIKNNGYKFLYYGDAFFQEKIIPKKYRGVPLYSIRTMISTEFIWNAMNYLAMAGDSPLFLLIHSDFETHAPYYCPESDELNNPVYKISKEKQLQASAWIDKQWEFYIDIMGNNSLKIFLGDHGDTEKHIYPFQNDRTNITLFIKDSYKTIDFSNRMFSLKRFPWLVSYLMDWGNTSEDDILSEYIISENYDFYSVGHVNKVINNPSILEDKNSWMQCRTIRDRQYVYTLFFDGEEMFFDSNDESNNLIDRPEYTEIIQSMREKLGTEFIDIYKEDFFVHSRKLYKAYNDKVSKS